MLKKLAVPLFSLALATFGCSSSTTPTGTGGTSGGTGGSSATGGKSGTGGSSATGGAGGGTTATGGAGGVHATGGAGGGATATGGAGGAKATGGAGGAATTTDAGRMADCTVTIQDGTSVLDKTVFCQNLIAYCSNVSGFTLPSAYATESMCEMTFSTNSDTSQKNCQSYHLCWGVEGITNTSPANPTVHCPHASAKALCLPTTDAASGG